MNKWRIIMSSFYQQCPYYQGACRYEQKRKENRDSYCLIKRFSTSKYLNESKKENDFLPKNEWFKSLGEEIDKKFEKCTRTNQIIERYLFLS